MQLVDEIISEATSDEASLSSILRKALVLAHQLKNSRLKEWASAELNGYSNSGDLPEYRIMRAFAKGIFLGGFNRQIYDQPIPSGVLEPEHRHFAQKVYLKEPIAAYRLEEDTNVNMIMQWPADLVLLYQDKFFPGQDMFLNRAWQEVPRPAIIGLNDVVRTRILQFALELKDSLGDVGGDPAKLSAEKVDRQVIYNIYGGTNVIAAEAKDFEFITNTVVSQNDAAGLADAFRRIGIEHSDFERLEHAMADDQKADETKKVVGSRTSE